MKKLMILFMSIILISLVTAQETVSKLNFTLLRMIIFILLPIAVLVISAILLKNKLKDKLWLKWGLLFEILLIGQILSYLVCYYTLICNGIEWCGIECLFPVWPQFYMLNVLGSSLITISLLSMLVYFLVGALIGFIIQKAKSK